MHHNLCFNNNNNLHLINNKNKMDNKCKCNLYKQCKLCNLCNQCKHNRCK